MSSMTDQVFEQQHNSTSLELSHAKAIDAKMLHLKVFLYYGVKDADLMHEK